MRFERAQHVRNSLGIDIVMTGRGEEDTRHKRDDNFEGTLSRTDMGGKVAPRNAI
jgi:hypothetical protein